MAKRDDETNGDDQVITRGILREELAALRAEMSELRTELRTEFSTRLDLAVGAIVARMDAGFAAFEQRMHADWTRTVAEQTAATLSVIDDKYADLPPRVTRLETKVFRSRRSRGRS